MGVGNLNNDVDFEVKEELENIVNEFLKAVSNTNNKVNENRDNIYYLFILHIRALMRRLKYGINIKNPLLNKIKEDYSKQFSDVSVLARKILSEKISEDEIAYLTVYTESILKLNNLKTKVVLVCNSGFGTSLFLKKRIEDKLKNIEEVEEFHDDYFGGEMISLSLADLRHLADGNFLAWHVKGEYSESLCLDENAKEALKRLL